MPVGPEDRDRWAAKGWVDLRPANFARWQERLPGDGSDPTRLRPARLGRGDPRDHPLRAHRDGTVVAWVLADELGGYRIK